MSRIARFVLYIITCFLLAHIIYFLSIDRIFPQIDYNNTVSFDLAYLNDDDILLVAFGSRGSLNDETMRIDVPKSLNLNHISLKVPFVYRPTFYFLFGESNKITFAISNLSVNGFLVEPEKIKNELESIGYKVKIRKSVVYAQPFTESFIGTFDLYKVSDKFINFDQNQLNDYQTEDCYLRIIYFFVLLFFVFFAISFLYRFCGSIFSDKLLFHYSIFLYIVLFCIAIVLSYNQEDNIAYKQLALLFKNYFVIVYLPLFLLLLTTRFNFLMVKYITIFVATLFLMLVGLDHFAKVVFGTRFLFDSSVKFAGTLLESSPFLFSYFSSSAGQILILSFICYLSAFFLSYKPIVNNRNLISLVIVMLIGISMSTWNTIEHFKFYNTFQVNINGFFTDGDYKRPYEKYIPYSNEQLQYVSYSGLNRKENVIIILVESLACDVTFLCGNENNYSPYMKQLAKENVWFPFYYSNNFHTNGAIFTITTGLPLVNGPNGEKTFFNINLYSHDVINKFKTEGYDTAYYTPASLVLNKKQQLEISRYSYISSVTDHFYDQKEKNGVFSSVSDEEMFNKIIYDLKLNNNPKFYMLTTISTHTPYITPWGSHNIELAYAYTDSVLKKFLKDLENINYFDNGIVIVTGDHKGWGNKGLKNSNSTIDAHRLPLILINGKDHGIVKNNVIFSHSSLGIMLEYFMLPTYEKNKFQINPWTEKDSFELILNYDANMANIVLVKQGNKNDSILLDGDKTRFLKKNFSDAEQQSILGFLSWIRQ